MIIGKNYYEESQKLFSTGDSELDDLLEEVYYSGIEDGYDYAQKEFAEKEVKLEPSDAFNYYGNYGLMRKGGVVSKLERDRISGDTKKNAKNAAILGGAGGSVYGGVLGGMAGGKKGALIGTAAGAAVGAGSAAIGSAAGTALRHKMEKGDGKFSKKYKKNWEKQEDLLDLKEGKITKEEFVKKWGGKIDGKKIKGSENE